MSHCPSHVRLMRASWATYCLHSQAVRGEQTDHLLSVIYETCLQAWSQTMICFTSKFRPLIRPGSCTGCITQSLTLLPIILRHLPLAFPPASSSPRLEAQFLRVSKANLLPSPDLCFHAFGICASAAAQVGSVVCSYLREPAEHVQPQEKQTRRRGFCQQHGLACWKKNTPPESKNV